MTAKAVLINYTNWRGERATRRIAPMALSFAASEWHPGRQWLLEAIDLDKNEKRFFAMKDVHSWQPVSQ